MEGSGLATLSYGIREVKTAVVMEKEGKALFTLSAAGGRAGSARTAAEGKKVDGWHAPWRSNPLRRVGTMGLMAELRAGVAAEGGLIYGLRVA